MYQALATSALDSGNWGKDMKYLIPSLAQFMTSMICKFPEDMKQCKTQLQGIILNLMSSEIRMETVGLQLASTYFERLGVDDEFMNQFLMSIFTQLQFYRNNTKNKIIPVSITRAVHIFFGTFMINFGNEALMNHCDRVQPGILFMILKSEGDKIKFCTAPARDRKYVIAAYTKLVCEFP